MDLERELSEATWLPKARRETAWRTLMAWGDEVTRPLLEFALATRQPEAITAWEALASRTLRGAGGDRLTRELLEHLVTISGARSVKPAVLRAALAAVLTGPAADLPRTRAALLALGRGVSLADAHAVYIAATRKAEPDALPKEPPHLGGPAPELTVFSMVELATHLARVALEKAPAPAATRVLALAEQELAWARGGRRGAQPTREDDVPAPAKAKGPGFALARAALVEARNLDHVSARGTALKSAVQLGLALGGAWWLAQVDDAVMLADARHAWERRKQAPSASLAFVLWRGEEGVLCRLTNGSCALLSKVGRSWTSTEGSLERLTAMLPARARPVIERRRTS